MTEEELAKEYSKTITSVNLFNERLHRVIAEQAFLAGLKAGSQLDKVWHDYDAGEDSYEDSHEGRWVKREPGLQWHDLRKNPNDLPEDTYDVLDQAGCKVHYNFFQNVWVNEKDEVDEHVIAWCEIPTFKE